MADFGAKGSVKGSNVLTAVDYLLQFSSSWPLLKIHETGVISGDVTHSLGYPPFHFLATTGGRINQLAGDEFAVDNTILDRFTGSSTPRYFICRLSLTENFTASSVSGGTTLVSPSEDYGYKVSIPGEDISSSDLRDFSLYSRTRSLMVHQVTNITMSNTGGGLGWEAIVSHNLGYTPIAFAFLSPGTNGLGLPTGKYGIVPTAVGVSGRYYSASSTNVYITADNFDFTGTPTVSVVILKDPFTRETINLSFP